MRTKAVAGTKRITGYVRVSRTSGRSGPSFISPAQQRMAIERMAEAKGLTIIEWFEELNESGGNGRRPLWNKAVQMCERGEAEGIAVLNLSRFSRSTIDALAMIERIEASGGTLYSGRRTSIRAPQPEEPCARCFSRRRKWSVTTPSSATI
jgi:DNA invertase Pin-like site-specific DNA recombinase